MLGVPALKPRVSRAPHGGRGFRPSQYLFLRCYCFETSREADGQNKARRPSKIRLLERGATGRGHEVKVQAEEGLERQSRQTNKEL